MKITNILSVITLACLILSCKKEKVQDTSLSNETKSFANSTQAVITATDKVFDGPYVFQENGKTQVKYILDKKSGLTISSQSIDSPKDVEFTVGFNDTPSWNFNVKISKELKQTPSRWKTDDKIFVISDIEGEFSVLRDLLIGAGVINDKYEWTFGNGQLIIGGDTFDRGKQVPECLWLFYKLEAEGGNLHFLLGNHDVMNISGSQSNYVNSKYFKTVQTLGLKKPLDLYAKNTVLGAWLRTKNIIEIGNNILFVHAGVSRELVDEYPNSTIENFNTISKANYDSPKATTSSKDFLTGDQSLIWFRGYFKDPLLSQKDVDFISKHFAVDHMIFGHTTHPEVGSFYNGKVYCTDVDTHDGIRQGILIKPGDIAYKLSITGKNTVSTTKL
ncbi:metallophosphoesterase [Pedobacter lusitanus]|uniref:metallophosphoesterase n=1 Tax=Pedobacter lusitanus TaxID=1503925 RepID=UPI0006982EAB|nr:metallophosphoesterase [Pedobacter lusitanus]